MKVCLLFNPRAGAAVQIDDLRRLLDRKHRLTVVETRDAADLARQAAAAAARYDAVAIAGGDGTLHAVVTGLGPNFPRAGLAILPLGTGNDLCRTLAVPLDPTAAVKLIRHGRKRAIDVARLEGVPAKFMVNAATGGFSGRVAADVTPELKQAWGPLAYLRGAAGPIADRQTFRVTLRVDGGPPETTDDVLNLVVANGRTAAGGVLVAPTANPEDGLLDVVVVRAGGLLDLSVVAASLMAGDYLAHENVSHRRAKRVEVESDPPMPFSIDGELVETGRITFDVLPKVLRVFPGKDYRPDPKGKPVGRGITAHVFGAMAGTLHLLARSLRWPGLGVSFAAVAVLLVAWLTRGVIAGDFGTLNHDVGTGNSRVGDARPDGGRRGRHPARRPPHRGRAVGGVRPPVRGVALVFRRRRAGARAVRRRGDGTAVEAVARGATARLVRAAAPGARLRLPERPRSPGVRAVRLPRAGAGRRPAVGGPAVVRGRRADSGRVRGVCHAGVFGRPLVYRRDRGGADRGGVGRAVCGRRPQLSARHGRAARRRPTGRPRDRPSGYRPAVVSVSSRHLLSPKAPDHMPAPLKPIRKLLVANRSEIAIRVCRSAHELGVRTVAIYSHEDRFALHRFKADEAYRVGKPGEPIRAYLDIPGIVGLAKDIGVDAIHPGYGFLSENAQFARACAEAGITFVGPRPEVLESLGDKTAARKLARLADVPVLSGSDDALTDVAAAQALAAKLTYPVIVKASRWAAAAAACASSATRRSWPRRWNRPAVRPAPRSATAACFWKNSSSGPSTSKFNCSATSTAASSTFSSGTARSSGGTKKSSNSPRPRTSTRRSATASSTRR